MTEFKLYDRVVIIDTGEVSIISAIRGADYRDYLLGGNQKQPYRLVG